MRTSLPPLTSDGTLPSSTRNPQYPQVAVENLAETRGEPGEQTVDEGASRGEEAGLTVENPPAACPGVLGIRGGHSVEPGENRWRHSRVTRRAVETLSIGTQAVHDRETVVDLRKRGFSTPSTAPMTMVGSTYFRSLSIRVGDGTADRPDSGVRP